MNIRRFIYVGYSYLRGHEVFKVYQDHLAEITSGISPDVTRKSLVKILLHCQKSVPYYSDLMNKLGNEGVLEENPELYLKKLPILTKDNIRNDFDKLKSISLDKRRWRFNTSGGSTGEPVKFIQDRVFDDRSAAITLLYSKLVGRELGEPEVRLWGSERDVFQNTMGWKANFFNFLGNTRYFNAFKMTPSRMKGFIQALNTRRPKLIIAYAQAIYELAKFAENEKIKVIPQEAIMTSAGTLYPWMREKIETVFQCKVFNRYGSREVGDIACERPGYEGLWVAPWGNYVEIVDDDNNPLPDGVEGNILITCLTNYAMPLIRYKIGDIGALLFNRPSEQSLQQVSGRSTDMFTTQDGTLVDGEYFTHLLYFKDWVHKFQITQNDYSDIYIKIVKSDSKIKQEELDDIGAKCKLLVGKDCAVKFEFVNDISTSASGKYRYTISEIA